MARRSNESIVKDQLESLAGELLEEIFEVFKASGNPLGLRQRRDIIDRVLAKVDTIDVSSRDTMGTV